MRLISVYEASEAVEVLYELLAERPVKSWISHRQMPTRAEHETFVASKPYATWYLIAVEEDQVGDDEGPGDPGGFVGARDRTSEEYGTEVRGRNDCGEGGDPGLGVVSFNGQEGRILDHRLERGDHDVEAHVRAVSVARDRVFAVPKSLSQHRRGSASFGIKSLIAASGWERSKRQTFEFSARTQSKQRDRRIETV